MRKKISRLTLCLTLLIAAALTPAAWGGGADWPVESLTAARDLSFLSVAVGLEEQRRDIESSDRQAITLHSQHVFGLLSCDLLDFLTFSAGTGYVETKPDKFAPQEGGDMLWLAGVRLIAWEHMVDSPAFVSSRLRLDTELFYWDYQAARHAREFDWNETRATLRFSSQFLTKPRRDGKVGYPHSLVLAVGAVYSKIEGTAGMPLDAPAGSAPSRVTFEEVDTWGGLAGMDLYIAENLSLSVEGRFFENTSVTFGGAFHF